MNELRLRRPIRDTNIKFRDYSITSNDLANRRRLRLLLMLLLASGIEAYLPLSLLVLRRLHKLKYAPQITRIHSYDCNVTIDDFGCAGHYKATFGFKREDLHRLLGLLEIPPRIWLSNGSVFTNEAVLLFALYRYKSADDILKFISRFGRDPTQLTRVFQWFNTFMLERWGHKLKNNLEYWKRFLPSFAEAIRKKVVQKSNNMLHYEEGQFSVLAFTDDNVNHISRPGAGPKFEGTRDERNIQRAFYNGWKKHHGIKWQSIELPNGMSMDLFGPMSFRRHDLDLVIGNTSNFDVHVLLDLAFSRRFDLINLVRGA
jgi:hypothetical protein